MQVKLTIVLIGNINAGKSSLINALLEKEVADVSAKGGETSTSAKYTLESGNLTLEIVDTPGLSEVGGAGRANLAIEAARKGDLILFAVASDLLDDEQKTIKHLYKLGKPIILIFNQIDKYTEKEQKDILNSLTKNVQGMISKENILSTAASPVQTIIYVNEKGEDEPVEREGMPDVEKLKKRIRHLADTIGKHVAHISGYYEQLKRVNKDLDKTKILREKAIDTSFNHAVGIGVATAINPVPLLDMIGGAAGVGKLIMKIADIYNIPLSMKEAQILAKELLFGIAAVTGVAAAAVIGIGSLVKMIPFVGWAIGGAAQTASVAFIVYIIGDTVNDYYANGQKWAGNNSLKESLEKKMQSVDKDEMTRRLKEQINAKLNKAT